MKISVVIPSFNRADLLPRTVASVAGQTLPPFETIIVDDESKDDTPAVVERLKREYPDLSITFIRHDRNKGESGARNTGLAAATGDVVAFLDSDDEWLPEKLERQAAFLNHTGADGVFCECFLVTGSDYKNAPPVRIAEDTIIPHHLMTRGCGYGTGTNLMIRRAVLSTDDVFDEDLRLFADLDWLYRVAQKADLRILHEPLSYYHKAAMRPGEYIAQRAKIFLDKKADMLRGWPLHRRLQVRSCMNWYIAHAYHAHGKNIDAARHFAMGILQAPIRHPGHYIQFVKTFTAGLAGGGKGRA